MVGAGSEGGDLRLVAGLGDGVDQVLRAGALGVVVNLDAGRGEVHLHVFDAGELANLLLDLGDARGAGEALGAKDGVGGGLRGHGVSFRG